MDVNDLCGFKFAVYFDTCKRYRGAVGHKISTPQASKHKPAGSPVLIGLINRCIRFLKQIKPVCRTACPGFILIDHRAGRKIEFVLAYIEITSTINGATLINTCTQVTIISTLFYFSLKQCLICRHYHLKRHI